MIDITNLEKAYDSLIECYSDYKKNPHSKFIEYIQDSCVKRFEYTFETAWKLMKKYLKTQYLKSEEELTMNNIFRYMAGYGIIRDWQVWKKYCEKRNNTAHEYNINKSKYILDIIPDFLEDVKFFISKLR